MGSWLNIVIATRFFFAVNSISIATQCPSERFRKKAGTILTQVLTTNTHAVNWSISVLIG